MKKDISQLADLIFAYYPKIRKLFRNLVSIKDIPITVTQLTCMHILSQNRKLSMSELASDLCMSNQQLTKVVDVLTEYGMVERICDPKNRRKFYAQLTPKGEELLSSLKNEVEYKLSAVLHKKSSDEIDKLYDSIAYFMSYFGYKEK